MQMLASELPFGSWADQKGLIISASATALCGVVLVCSRLLQGSSKSQAKAPPLAAGTWDVMIKALSPDTSLATLRNLYEKHGPVFQIPTPPLAVPKMFFVMDWADADMLLSGNPSKGFVAGDKHPMLYGILRLVSNGIPNIVSKRTDGQGPHHGWDWVRKGTAPSLSRANIARRFPLFQAEAEQMVKQFTSTTGQQLDVFQYMNRLFVSFFCKAMFDFHDLVDASGNDLAQRFIDNASIAIEEYALKTSSQQWRRIYFWDSEVRRAWKACQGMEDFSLHMLKHYRTTHTKEEIEHDSCTMASIVKAPYPSDRARAADISTYLTAAHETSASSLTFVLSEICKREDVVQKLRAELDQHNPSRGRWELADIEKLSYVTSCIWEGLRLWPAVTLFGREIRQDMHLIDGSVIPAGAQIWTHPFIANKRGLKNPEKYMPERYQVEDEDSEKLKQNYTPFGKGKRNCVGKELAILSLKTLIAYIIQNFDVTQTSETKLWNMGVLAPKNTLFEFRVRT